ncbi:TetR family transcriptional regulator [Tumebacillus algifaecis]|uniref:TetR family transcriptional regulator n=1 Tax=Tumebacillus algifaecis TaxID=1214604 RepID=A0A223D497_9BACL|nr:TetR/AcrR family transcriptional regulator [Tumebacillus algifaecis]ASS76411.1 TetR family transcriptional regulator [Tumebacillus algifaecis]
MSSRRERKKQETRTKIFTSAMKLFQAGGYDATTIDMIAEHADVARGTVFLHFPSKEAILAHWGQDRFEEMMERSVEWDQPDLSVEEKVMRLFKIALTANQESFDLVKIWVKSTLATPTAMIHERQSPVSLRNLMADILESAQEEGHLKQTIDPIIAGDMLENIYLHAMQDWVLSEGNWPVEEILTTKIHYLFNGLNQ